MDEYFIYPDRVDKIFMSKLLVLLVLVLPRGTSSHLTEGESVTF